MRELVRSALPRDWVVDERRVLIDPPTVRDALEVLVTYEGYSKGDDADTEVFRDAVRRWLPASIADSLVADDADRGRTATLVLGLVLEGVEPAKATPSKKGAREIKSPTLHTLGFYCRIYSADPWTVYTTTPWPFYLLFLQESRRQQASKSLSDMRSSMVSGMSSNGIRKMTRDLEKDLGFVKLTPEEQHEFDMEASREGIKVLQMIKANP